MFVGQIGMKRSILQVDESFQIIIMRPVKYKNQITVIFEKRKAINFIKIKNKEQFVGNLTDVGASFRARSYLTNTTRAPHQFHQFLIISFLPLR